VGVVGGGCSGFQYSMDFENAEREGDVVVEQDGLRLFVDPMSSMYLMGVTVDYVQGLQGAGFKFNNPNAKNTCGCGSSFSA
jgi:iron-sulfur cluster assembly accessory protein